MGYRVIIDSSCALSNLVANAQGNLKKLRGNQQANFTAGQQLSNTGGETTHSLNLKPKIKTLF